MADKEMIHGHLDAGELRRHSVGTVEIQDAKGRRKTVQLDELNAADRALAEQFGYKPVCVGQKSRSPDPDRLTISK
jgi:hypothetical protein